MTDAAPLNLSAEFLTVASCPACHAKFAVDYDRSELVCSSITCGIAYPVVDGIPVLVVDQARSTL